MNKIPSMIIIAFISLKKVHFFRFFFPPHSMEKLVLWQKFLFDGPFAIV